jgi:hypothetical protein
MASGYEKSDNYAGPEPRWSPLMIAAVAIEIFLGAYLILRVL